MNNDNKDNREVDFFDNPVERDQNGNIIPPEPFDSEKRLTGKDVAKGAAGLAAVVGTAALLNTLAPGGLNDGPPRTEVPPTSVSVEADQPNKLADLPESTSGQIVMTDPVARTLEATRTITTAPELTHTLTLLTGPTNEQITKTVTVTVPAEQTGIQAGASAAVNNLSDNN